MYPASSWFLLRQMSVGETNCSQGTPCEDSLSVRFSGSISIKVVPKVEGTMILNMQIETSVDFLISCQVNVLFIGLFLG